MKVTFPYQLLVVLLRQSLAILCNSSFKEVHLIRWRYIKLVVKKFYLCTWLRNVPETSDEQQLNFLNWNMEIWVFFSRVMVNIVL